MDIALWIMLGYVAGLVTVCLCRVAHGREHDDDE